MAPCGEKCHFEMSWFHMYGCRAPPLFTFLRLHLPRSVPSFTGKVGKAKLECLRGSLALLSNKDASYPIKLELYAERAPQKELQTELNSEQEASTCKQKVASL